MMMSMYKSAHIIYFIFASIVVLLPSQVDALFIGVPIVAISLVKVVAVVLSLIAVPLTVLIRMIKKDWRWAILLTFCILVSIFVSTLIISQNARPADTSNAPVGVEDMVATEVKAQPQVGTPILKDEKVEVELAVFDTLVNEFIRIGSVVVLVLSIPLLSLLVFAKYVYALDWSGPRVVVIWGLTLFVASLGITCALIVYRGVLSGVFYL